jgi:hypothetical protein
MVCRQNTRLLLEMSFYRNRFKLKTVDRDLHGILKIMGFDDDSRGIINRYIKVEGAWDPHLKNSRNFILDCVKNRKYENVAVYGSGWLLDLPLEQLSDLCDHVWLYDLVHPRQILHKIKKFKNVTPVTADVSGVLKDVYEFVRSHAERNSGSHAERNSGSHAERIDPSHPERSRRVFGTKYASTPLSMTPVTPLKVTNETPQPDFSISLNLLSQIGDLVTGYLSRHVSLSETEAEDMTAALQESHLELLKKQPSCLITDVKEVLYDKDDKPCGTKQLIKCSLPAGIRSATWQWDFDPLAEYNPGYITRSEVIALEL